VLSQGKLVYTTDIDMYTKTRDGTGVGGESQNWNKFKSMVYAAGSAAWVKHLHKSLLDCQIICWIGDLFQSLRSPLSRDP